MSIRSDQPERERFFTTPPSRVIAHRGLAIEAPENTLLAFAKALAVGVTYLETDVHESADGVAVVSHDDSLKRVAARSVRVNQLTMAELRRVDLGFGQNFTSLVEAIDAFPDARFNIDVKSSAAVGPTVEAIRAANAQHRVLVTSFSGSRRHGVVRQIPDVATSADYRAMASILAASRLGFSRRAVSLIGRFDALQLPEQWKGLRVVTPNLVRLVHEAGAELHVWTVNQQDDMERLLDLGVDGIVTDRADIAMEVLRTRS